MQTSMMKYTVALVAALSVGCTQNTSAEKPANAGQQPIEVLLKEIDALNSQCRGGSGDDPKTQLACDKREARAQEAEQRGWCWGPQGAAINADKHWMRCADDKTMEQRQTPATAVLFQEVHAWAKKCSDRASPSREEDCSKFGAKVEEARDKGWCWGPAVIDGSERRWVRCNSYPAQQPNIETTPVSSGDEIVSIAKLKKMTVIGMEMFKPFRVSAMINAIGLGTDGLCARLRPDGYCELGVEPVHVNILLDDYAEREKLYDLRGRTGAAICATVVMHPRNVNGTLNLTSFTPGGCR